MHFLGFNLEIFTPSRNFYTDDVCGVCYKYEACKIFDEIVNCKKDCKKTTVPAMSIAENWITFAKMAGFDKIVLAS